MKIQIFEYLKKNQKLFKYLKGFPGNKKNFFRLPGKFTMIFQFEKLIFREYFKKF